MGNSPSTLSFLLKFELDVKTIGTLNFNLKNDTFDVAQVFIGNASETRFINFEA